MQVRVQEVWTISGSKMIENLLCNLLPKYIVAEIKRAPPTGGKGPGSMFPLGNLLNS